MVSRRISQICSRLPQPVDQDRQDQAQRGADAGRFRRRGDAAVEHVHHADDDGEERRDLRDRAEFFLPGVAEVRRVRAEAAAPDREHRPQHEQPGQHGAGNHAGDEQPADRGLGGDAVEDEGDRRRNENAERAAGADRAGGDLVRIAAAAHLRNAHLADGGAAGGRRAGERREDRAGAEIGNHQPAGQPVEPAVERLVEILAGRRGADRRAHHHEHRDRDQGEFVEAGIEGLGDDLHAVEALEDQQKDDRDRAEAEGHRHARQQHQQGDDEDDGALRGRAHAPSVASFRSRSIASERRRRGRHQAEQFGDVLQDQKAEPDRHRRYREPTAARARPCPSASLSTKPRTRYCVQRTNSTTQKPAPAGS